MDKRFATLLVLLLTGLLAAARPAKPGPITLIQPDGKTFSATLKGDEFGHVLTTADGCAVIQDRDGYYCYAYFDFFGNRFNSGVRVGDRAESDVLVGSRQIPYGAVASLASRRRMTELSLMRSEEPILKRILERAGSAGAGTAASSSKASGAMTSRGTARSGAAKTSGSAKTTAETAVKHGLVILAEFSDIPFTYDKSDFEALLTQSGYDVNGATGSAMEYFNDQFGGLYDFQFTVSDIVTLSQERAYYGGNDSAGNDERPEEMVQEACTLADNGIDFSQFDDDGDGVVDNVFVFFAGGDEAEGAGDDCIWSHAYYIYSGARIDLVLDGVRIDRYACSSELTIAGYTIEGYDYEITGIGTFCHEYSHTFGLPDLYDTDYDNPDGSSVAAGLWGATSLMDSGNYNNSGNTPPYYNAVERDWLGLWDAETLEPGDYSLEPVNLNGRYLKMETGNPGEFFLLECRANSGWDAYINNGSAAAGLLIYHIDQSETDTYYSPTYDIETSPYLRWTVYNEVNADPDHQCADLIEADNRSDKSTSTAISNANRAGIFFPAGRTEYTPETEPAFTAWDGHSSELCITDIAMDGDNVTFTVIASSDIATPYAVNVSAVTFQDAAILSWESDYSTTRKAHMTVTDDQAEAYEISSYSMGSYAFVAEGLTPGKRYTAKIWYEDFDGEPGTVTSYSFTTKSLSTSSNYAYIYFTTPANEDGSFTSGTKIPLRVYNATDAESVTWLFGGNEITVGDDGYYELTSAGTLKATVTYADGSTEIIQRKITITTPTEEETE